MTSLTIIVAATVNIVAVVYFHLCLSLLPLRTRSLHTRLGFSPTRLSIPEIIIVILLFFARTLKQMVLQNFLRVNSTSRPPVPKLSLSMPLILQASAISAYISAIAGQDHPFSSPTDVRWTDAHLLLFLSAVSEPAMLLLLAKHSCPIQPLGAVNVRNSLELLRPDLCRSSDSLKNLRDANIIANLLPTTREVKRGLEYDLEVRIEVSSSQGEVITIFRQIFTMLQFQKWNTKAATPSSRQSSSHQSQSHTRPPKPEKQPIPSTPLTTQVSLTSSSPSLWAHLCKDYNPIHISTILAKLYGFPGKIAHGNHVVAKAVEAVSRATMPESEEREQTPHVDFLRGNGSGTSRGLGLTVHFRRPVVVPANLEVKHFSTSGNEEAKQTTQAEDRVSEVESKGPQLSFQVFQRDKVCVEGEWSRT